MMILQSEFFDAHLLQLQIISGQLVYDKIKKFKSKRAILKDFKISLSGGFSF